MFVRSKLRRAFRFVECEAINKDSQKIVAKLTRVYLYIVFIVLCATKNVEHQILAIKKRVKTVK